MSVASLGSSASQYLQSLLQKSEKKSTSPAGETDPLASLMSAFYPNGQNGTSNDATTATSSKYACQPFSPDTMGALIDVQGQQKAGTSSKVQSLFQQFDTDGDGKVSKSEFETAFGSNADTSKVDGLFNALDSDSDGTVSLSELASAAQQSQPHHRRHAGGSGGSKGGLADLLSSTDATGATTDTASNADGSTTITISYADGSKVTMTTPTGNAVATAPGKADSGTSAQQSFANTIEQLIRMQAQTLAQTAANLTATLTA